MGFSAWLLPTRPEASFQISLKVMTSLFPQQRLRVRVSLGIREGETFLNILLSSAPVGQREGNVIHCEVKMPEEGALKEGRLEYGANQTGVRDF